MAGSGMRAALALPDFRRLMGAQLLSELGDWAARLALTFLVWRGTQSATLTALIVSISLLPALGPGQWLTVLSDRLPVRTVLVTTDLVRAALFTLLAVVPSTGLALAVSFLTGLFAVPFNSKRAAILPEVTGPERLVAGVKVSQILQDFAVIGGYTAGGLLVALFTVPGALVFNAVSFAVSALLLAGLHCPVARAVVPAEHRVSLRGGLATIRSMPRVWAAVGLSVVALAGGVAVESVVVPIAAEFSDQAWLPTALLVATAAVSIVATMAVPSTFTQWRLLWASLALIVVPAIVMVLAFGYGVGISPLIGVVASGLLFAAPVPANALAAGVLPPLSRASVFSLVAGVIATGQAVGTALTGRLFDSAGFAGLAVLAAGVIGVAGAITLAARAAERLGTRVTSSGHLSIGRSGDAGSSPQAGSPTRRS